MARSDQRLSLLIDCPARRAKGAIGQGGWQARCTAGRSDGRSGCEARPIRGGGAEGVNPLVSVALIAASAVRPRRNGHRGGGRQERTRLPHRRYAGRPSAGRDDRRRPDRHPPYDPAGITLTADALHTQRDHAHFLVEEKKAHHPLVVKTNPPELLRRLRSPPWKDVIAHRCG
ncbi:hypothetical protein [Streptomyces sp. NBC_01276]|uniref:hypothetical protein n=1 Tax=Streptomyces sp. NBC_01276 TaxID=2903808 RepID=UPI00352E4E06